MPETRYDVWTRPDCSTPWEAVLSSAPWWLAEMTAKRCKADGLSVKIIGWERLGPQSFEEG